MELNNSNNNFNELFSNNPNWIVDDKSVYRVSIEKTIEGNLITHPINGVIFILNPSNGLLYLKVIHKDVWNVSRRVGQTSKLKTAEEVSALIHSLPFSEQPKEIILTRHSMFEPLDNSLKDLPNIVLKVTELQLPFQVLLKINNKICTSVSNATESLMILYNVYDDWLNKINSKNAFKRLFLLLRSFEINFKNTNEIFKLQQQITQFNSNNIWPTFNEEQWLEIEKSLQHLILDDYCLKNNTTIEYLNKFEINDIILGKIKPEKI